MCTSGTGVVTSTEMVFSGAREQIAHVPVNSHTLNHNKGSHINLYRSTHENYISSRLTNISATAKVLQEILKASSIISSHVSGIKSLRSFRELIFYLQTHFLELFLLTPTYTKIVKNLEKYVSYIEEY